VAGCRRGGALNGLPASLRRSLRAEPEARRRQHERLLDRAFPEILGSLAADVVFPPFALALAADGDIERVRVVAGEHDGPLPPQRLEALQTALQLRPRSRLTAALLVYDAWGDPEELGTDEVLVLFLWHRGAGDLRLLLPYRREPDGITWLDAIEEPGPDVT
jgi:hypothetical protein